MLQNNTSDLYHHGIPGQKWGVRRYQNKDGSLTPAGRKRAAKLEEQYKKVTGRNIKKELARKPKTVSEMTNEELKSKATRLRLENDLSREEQTYKSLHPAQISKGRQFTSHVWKNVIAPAATEAGKNFLTNWMKNVGNDILNSSKEIDPRTKLKNEVDDLRLKKDKLSLDKQIKDLETGPSKLSREVDDLRLKKEKLALKKQIKGLKNK